MKMANESPRPAGGAAVRKKKKKLKPAAIILIAAIVVLVAAAAVLGFLVFNKYNSIADDINGMQQMASDLHVDDQTKIPQNVVSEEVDPDTGVIPSLNDLHTQNPDIMGYLQIPGTQLYTAVVQGADNEHYLYYNYKDQKAALGVPFVDARATINADRQSENLTIYGHSAKDGSYFATLKNYKDVSFYKEHPVILFDTLYGKGAYKIIGLFMENVNYEQNPEGQMFEYHNKYDLNEDDFNDYIANVMKRSYFTTSVDVKYGDKLITLSTCDYDVNDKDFRIALVARQVRPDETTEVDTSGAVSNGSMIMPKEWVAKFKKDNPYK